MEITAALVNELRQKSGAGMMDCKKALTEAGGDLEKAMEILRKKGAAVAQKRAEKATLEGIVATKVAADKASAAIAEVNCETDFVAKSEAFIAFAANVAASVLETGAANGDALLAAKPALSDAMNELVGKVGEKTVLSRVKAVTSDNGVVVDYIHPGSKLGVLVVFNNTGDALKEEIAPLAKDIAMQVAAMRPIAVYREEVDPELVAKEMEIYKELARKEGKPEQILEKIATGRLNKFYEENCLNEQAFIKDNSKNIKDLIAAFNAQHKAQVKLASFLRYHLGDEKK